MGQYQTVKHIVIGIPKEKRENRGKNIYKLKVEKFSKLIKDSKMQSQKAQSKPMWINNKVLHPYNKIAEN